MEQFTNPTDANPFELDKNCVFYSNHFIIDDLKIDYSDIATIVWKNSRKTMNGFDINSDTDYVLLATKENYSPDLTDKNSESLFYAGKDFSFKVGIIKTHRAFLKRQSFVHNFLYEISRSHRIEKALNTISKFGYITPHNELKIFDNGDFINNGKFEGNLLERFRENKLINGVKYGGYSHNVTNPYEFGFIKGTRFFGIFEDKFIFHNVSNADIMDILFHNLFKNGKLSAF